MVDSSTQNSVYLLQFALLNFKENVVSLRNLQYLLCDILSDILLKLGISLVS